MEHVRINGKLTKMGKRNRAMLKEECKSISAAELVSYMEKQKSLPRKLESNFIEDKSMKKQGPINSCPIQYITGDITFLTRSLERFGNKHFPSDLQTRVKQRIFPPGKK